MASPCPAHRAPCPRARRGCAPACRCPVQEARSPAPARPPRRAAKPRPLSSSLGLEGGLQCPRSELHVVRAPELLLEEIHLERLGQLLAVPLERAQELLVVVAFLVPVGEQRRGDVDALPVPALRDHVDLLP